MSKNWMYNSLVDGLDDKTGLIAYSIYKFEKNELAESLVKQNKTQKQIEKDLATFHDQANVPGRIASYRERAEILVEDLMDQLELNIRAEYQEQFDNINILLSDYDKMEEIIKNQPALIEKEREEAVLAFYRTVTKREAKKRGGIVRTLLWIRDGFQGVCAAIILAVIIYGFCVVVLPSEDRQGVVDKAYNNLRSSFFQQPNSPVPSVETGKVDEVN